MKINRKLTEIQQLKKKKKTLRKTTRKLILPQKRENLKYENNLKNENNPKNRMTPNIRQPKK